MEFENTVKLSEIINDIKESYKEKSKNDFDDRYSVFDNFKIIEKDYLPLNIKIALALAFAENTCDIEDGVYTENPIKFKMISDLLYLKYTNIVLDNEINVDDYDYLKDAGFFDNFYCGMQNLDDYKLLIDTLKVYQQKLIDKSKEENKGLNGFAKQIIKTIFDNIVELNKTKDGKKAIKDFLESLNNNPELLDAINNIVNGFGLDKVKDELEKRVKNIKKK